MSVVAFEESTTRGSNNIDFLTELLRDQQSLTVVEKFANEHDADVLPAQAKYYRDLIPLSAPRAGEQYAFEVDLDACSGCKACVAACHSLNGLEEAETWRSVGLLTGGSAQTPVLQHVTSACHHCLEPACLQGCPVNAYTKDPDTGIVRHLDDQCIGCQYCILKCPYDVPQYSRAKGIVRKCDMCHQRLAVGEAPACVQSCPNQAIRITIVDRQTVLDESEADVFLPGAAAPSYTLPTTVYRSGRPLPRNLLPADYYSASPQHAHWPLIVMLVLTQMSVGAFAVALALDWLTPNATAPDPSWRLQSLSAFGLGVVGLVGSLFHLGRPWLAYRAVIGLRSSWLSREIAFFGVFAMLAFFYAAHAWLPIVGDTAKTRELLGAAVVIFGLAGVWCSVMVYDSTRRPYWRWPKTAMRFFLSAIVLGAPCSILVTVASSTWSAAGAGAHVLPPHVAALFVALLSATALKLVFEATIFANLLSRRLTPLKRTAWLMRGELLRPTAWRYACGLAGGVVAPLFVLTADPISLASIAIAAVMASALCAAGEVLERYLFFTAVIAPKMPGAPGA